MAGRHPARPHLGGLGFGLKWNMGWMHDTLDYFSPATRSTGSYHHNEMTFAMMYAYTENFVLPLSPRRGRARQGLAAAQDARRPLAAARQPARAATRYMWAHPGKQLLFMGGEFGQEREWSEHAALDWWLLDDRRRTAASATWSRDLNAALPRHPALWQRDNDPDGFRWIDANDASGNAFSFLRCGDDRRLGARLRRQLRRRPARRLPGRPAARRAAGTRCSTPTPRSTAAPASATSAPSSPRSARGTAARVGDAAGAAAGRACSRSAPESSESAQPSGPSGPFGPSGPEA